MEKINFGITNFQPQIPDYEIPSFVDVYTSLHKPSIQNSFEQLQNLRTSIEESLANTKIPDTNQFLGAIPNFEMPNPNPDPNTPRGRGRCTIPQGWRQCLDKVYDSLVARGKIGAKKSARPLSDGSRLAEHRHLYHKTPRENLKSIFEKGLIPSPNFVSLGSNPESWYRDFACLVVDIDMFMKENPGVRITTWLPELDEVCVWGTIPPKYLKEIQ